MVDIEKTISSETGSNRILNMDELKENGKALEVLQKVLAELGADGNSRTFLSIMEKLIDIYDSSRDKNVTRLALVVTFLRILENCNVEEYNNIFYDLDKCLLSRELRKVTVDVAPITEYLILGQGDFGTVTLGKLSQDRCSFVAIKAANDEESSADVLLEEAKIMAGLRHENVVKILAFQRTPAKVVMEFVEGGNLRAAVENRRLDDVGILKALRDVAAGMEYVAGKDIIHRDLDMVNILVTSNKTCKIGDFGWARYVGHCPNGEYREKGQIKLFYLASPETNVTNIFTKKTDVWTFGLIAICLYQLEENLTTEMLYKTFQEYLVNYLTSGDYRSARPQLCPANFFEYAMIEILHRDPRRRPGFAAIKKRIGEILSSSTS